MFQGYGVSPLQGESGGFDSHLVHMGKVEKKRVKIQERITLLEDELRMSLTKKTSTTKEIDIAGHQRKIADLKKEFQNIK